MTRRPFGRRRQAMMSPVLGARPARGEMVITSRSCTSGPMLNPRARKRSGRPRKRTAASKSSSCSPEISRASPVARCESGGAPSAGDQELPPQLFELQVYDVQRGGFLGDVELTRHLAGHLVDCPA